MMINVRFDAKHGNPIRDGEAETVVANVVEQHQESGDVTVEIANVIVLDAFRVAVREQRISIDEITITIIEDGRERAVRIYPDGGVTGWTASTEIYDNLLRRLL